MVQGSPISSSQNILKTVLLRCLKSIICTNKCRSYKENIECGLCLQPTLVCIHLGPQMVFALLSIRANGLEHPEHLSAGKELIKLWLFCRIEYCVAIKNDVDES